MLPAVAAMESLAGTISEHCMLCMLLLALQVGELMLAAAARQGADFQPAQIKRIQVRAVGLPCLTKSALRSPCMCSRHLPAKFRLSPWLAAIP